MSADDARTLRGLIDWLGQLAVPVKESATGEAVPLVALFWTVPIRSETSRQKRFFIIFGAFQLTAAARRRRQAFAM